MRAWKYLCEQILPSAPTGRSFLPRAPLEVISLEARRVLDAAPVIDNQSFGVSEGAPTDALIGYVTASDADPADGLVFAITAGNADGLFKIDPLTGALRLAKSPNNSDVGDYALTVRVTDPTGKTDTATITASVLNTGGGNDNPVVNDQTFYVAAGSNVGDDVGVVVASDPDTLDVLSYSISGSEFSISNSGLIEVADAAAVLAPGKYVCTVTVTDLGTKTDTAQITIIVNGPPSDIAISNLTVDENATGVAIGTVTVTDPNFSPPGILDDAFTFEITGDPQNRFTIAGGELRLKAGASLDYEVASSINLTIKVTDRGGANYSEAFVVSVNNINEPPTSISLDNLSVNENAAGAIVGQLTVTDQDDSSFTYQILKETTPGNYVVDNRFEVDGTGRLKLLAGEALDHEAGATINLRVIATDSGNSSVQGNFTITVNDINEAPTDISLSATTVAENAAGATIGTITVTDPDNPAEPFGQPVISVLEDYGSGFVTSTRFEVVGGSLRLKSGVSLNYETETSVTIRIVAADGTLPAYTESFVITVTNVNEAPTDITLSNNTVLENVAGASIGTVAVVDPDSSAGPFGQHTLTVQEDYGSGFVNSTRFEIVAGELRLKSGVSLNHETAAQVIVRIIADDGTVPRFSKNFTIDVVDVNEPPTIISLSNASVNENAAGAVVGNVTVADPDNSAEPFGQHTFVVQEDYGGGFVTSTRFEIAGGQLRLKAGVSLNFEVTPQTTVRIYADDGTLPTFFKDFVITVANQNDLPVATNNSYSTNSSTILNGNVITDNTGNGVDFDEDGNNLTVFRANTNVLPGNSFTTALGATVTVQANGSFVYDPTNAVLLQALKAIDNLADSFTYRITDGQGNSNTATVTILVSGVNDAPTVAPTAGDAGVEDTSITYTHAQLLAKIGYADPDNPANTATIVLTNVQGGSLTLSGGTGGSDTTFRFDPAPNSHASITFNYQVVDADGELSGIGLYTITIRPVNDAPTVAIGDQATAEDVPLIIPLAGLYNDVETPLANAVISLVSTSDNHVNIAFNPATGKMSFVVAPNFNGVVTLTVRATDTGDGSNGLPDQAPLFAETTFVLTITPVDDAPVATDDVLNFDEDTATGRPPGALLANDSDVDNDPALNQFSGPSGINTNSFQVVTGPLHALSFVSNPDGSFSYVPQPNFFGSDSFQYVVFDAQGIASNIATVFLNIAPVNDPPTFVVDAVLSINPVLPRPQPITSYSAGPFENDQTVTFTVTSADGNVLLPPTVGPDPSTPGQLLLNFAPAPFINRVTTITITATDNLGASTVQVVTVNLVVGQVPPANLSLEVRQPLTFPPPRDTGVVADVNQRVAAIVAASLDAGGAGGDAASSGERQVEVYLLDPATGDVIGEAQFTLPSTSLDQLNEIFQRLPDDQYRIVLKLEDGSRRRVLDVIVRDKRPFDPGDLQDELLIPNEPMVSRPADDTPVAPPMTGVPSPSADTPVAPASSKSAGERDDPTLPLTPAKTQAPKATDGADTALAPVEAAAPLLMAAAIAQQRGRRRAAVQQTLAKIGRRPWLLHRLQRPS